MIFLLKLKKKKVCSLKELRQNCRIKKSFTVYFYLFKECQKSTGICSLFKVADPVFKKLI